MNHEQVMRQALEALETCDAAHPSDGGRQWYDSKLVEPAITALRAALAEPVQEQDIEDAIEAAYWQFDCRRSGLNEWASAPQSERDAFKAEARKLVRGYFPTRQAQDTKREMLAVVDAFIRGKHAALAEPQIDPVDEYRRGFIAGQIDMRDRELAEPVRCPASHVCDCQEAGQPCARAAPKPMQEPVANEIHGCHGGEGSTLPEQPVQEPVGYLPAYELSRLQSGHDGRLRSAKFGASALDEDVAVYTAPPQRKPLTDDEIIDAVRDADLDWANGWTLDEMQGNRFATLARAIERAHGIRDQR